MVRYLNHYHCDACDIGWADEWSCQCDDECPSCGKDFTPVASDDLDDDESADFAEAVPDVVPARTDKRRERKTVRLHLLISPSDLHAINEWGFQHRIRTKAEAVRRLCQIGLGRDAADRDISSAAMLSALKSIVSAFGGNVPDWLKTEFAACEEAIAAAEGRPHE